MASSNLPLLPTLSKLRTFSFNAELAKDLNAEIADYPPMGASVEFRRASLKLEQTLAQALKYCIPDCSRQSAQRVPYQSIQTADSRSSLSSRGLSMCSDASPRAADLTPTSAPAPTPTFAASHREAEDVVNKEEEEDPEAIMRRLGVDELTSVVVRNVPQYYNSTTLLQLLDTRGFKGAYDFIYVPINYRTRYCFGYAVINFVRGADARRFRHLFQRACDWGEKSNKVVEVCWCNSRQGLTAHIDRYQNSPIMKQEVPDAFKPSIFENGIRAAFPLPQSAYVPGG